MEMDQAPLDPTSVPGDTVSGKRKREPYVNGSVKPDSAADATQSDDSVDSAENDYLAHYKAALAQRLQQAEDEDDEQYQRLKRKAHTKLLARIERRAVIRHVSEKRAWQIECERRQQDQARMQQAAAHATQHLSTLSMAPSPTHTPSQALSVDNEMASEELGGLRHEIPTDSDLERQRRAVWRLICQVQVPKVQRIMTQSTSTRQHNCRKLVIACHRESRRALNRAKLTRDLPVRARRAMREMLVFWKRNEKEEREQRRKAEKAALEKLRQEEEEREAKRQARKLNFLITQTELFSHFIGRKVTAGRDDEDDDTTTTQDAAAALGTDSTPIDEASMELDIEGDTMTGPLDFDNDDDAKIRAQAQMNAQAALERQAERTRQFDAAAHEKRSASGVVGETTVSASDIDEMDFLNPAGMNTATEVQQPAILNCELKKYQLKGLQWLANLYDQGINGILADEMGLGKTVQSISLMAHLAESHNLWGPFLVVAPAVTLHNWHQEVSRFVPDFKVLPYWGTVNERKVLRKAWSKLYTKDAPFHILITSYQIVVADQSYFQKIKWQYMILDEAQAIKSSSSVRWKTLLKFNTRNRLLLTGTPIQNNMQELWALLHFIMPTLFDSHDEFSDWFAKDIESHAENKGTLNERKYCRLHMILKPFMLRRIKKHVQHELGDKIEIEVSCQLSARQRQMYRVLREKISPAELLRKMESSQTDQMDNLMNLVMQFRKVCNHPELFERAEASFPLACCRFGMSGPLAREGDQLFYDYSSRGLLDFALPKLLYHNQVTFDMLRAKYVNHKMNFWNNLAVHRSSLTSNGAFNWLRPMGIAPDDAIKAFYGNIIERCTLASQDKARQRVRKERVEHLDVSLVRLDGLDRALPAQLVEMLSITDALDAYHDITDCYHPKAVGAPVELHCSDQRFASEQSRLLLDTQLIAGLLHWSGTVYPARPLQETLPATVLAPLPDVPETPSVVLPLLRPQSFIHVPPLARLVLDSGKLARLDKLLAELKAGGHRVLIYFQMTRMIDLMEEYLAYRRYTYLRLDGSSKIEDRRDMVSDWQAKDDLFIFLLSTRAGGLGINLTAADTVIFYDSDWNPTVDQQAMDRAHRLGQTRQVTVYRLITAGTIEERILHRAKQKDEIQKVVIAGGDFRPMELKSREIVSLLMEDA